MRYPWQQAVWSQLMRQLGQGRVAHAVLLCGPAGLGKRQLGLDFAAALLCQAGEGPACGRCRSCQLLTSGAHPDFREVTFELNKKGEQRTRLRVGQIRDLIAALQLTHGLSKCKVALVHPADAMNAAAAAALLKTLEEPPGASHLLLVAHDAGRLPPTIRSRCQLIPLALPAESDAAKWLQESGRASPEVARLALRAAAGSPLRALELIQAGDAARFGEVDDLLDRMTDDPAAVDAVVQAIGSLEPVWAWRWLSLIAAARLEGALGVNRSGVGAADQTSRKGHRADPRRISELQQQADRNRRLLDTPVRKDLLLRDWLIQWARLTVP